MKALFLLLAILLGAVCAYTLNEDQLRDQLNYATSKRSKRALCGVTGRVTVPAPRPTPRPFNCYNCNCIRRPVIISKRAVAVSSKIASIVPSSCYWNVNEWNRCCRNIFYPKIASGPAVAKSAAAVDVNGMASNFIQLFGKRAITDSNFKKPSVDLVFLIDDSGSIPAAQFTVAKEGAATLSQAVCPHTFGSSKGGKQVSVVLFSTTAKTVLTYEESQKGAGYVENAILNMRQRSGATSTTDAIKHIRTSVLTQPGSRLNNPDTATIVIVITDGKCNDGCSELKAEAKKLREAGPGVQVFAFGIGEADCLELEDIRGKDAGNVFGLPDYNFFEKLANAVKQQMASNSDKACVK